MTGDRTNRDPQHVGQRHAPPPQVNWFAPPADAPAKAPAAIEVAEATLPSRRWYLEHASGEGVWQS